MLLAVNFIKKEILKDVNFNNIKEDRFKTGRVSMTLFTPLKNETASKNAIVPFILSKSCRNYPNLQSLHKKLDELYGASINADVSKLGEVQVLTISASFLDDKYSLDNETISDKVIDLFCQMIFDPLLENGIFPEDTVEQEKRQLIETIESEFNDKRIYAKNRCEELMCKNEKFGINRFGTIEQVKKLTSKEIFTAWQELLSTAKIELTLLGSADATSAIEIFEQAFHKVQRYRTASCRTEIIREASNVKEYVDEMELSQSKLVMGFRTAVAANDDMVVPMRVAVALFGTTPHSKLFLNVREKYSLCYYCSARYDRNKGIMLVQSGVENKNITKAKDEILNQLEDIKLGNFTQDDIDSIKRSMSNGLRTVNDYLSSIENFYLSQTFDNTKYTIDELIDKINSVSKEQIIDAAKSITLDTVYILKGKDENQMEVNS